MTHTDLDTASKGTTGPFEAWEGDHTALVHVLWSARRAGLTLAEDTDEIASMICRSRFLAARTANAIDAERHARALAELRAAVDKETANAEQCEARAAETRQELEEATRAQAHEQYLEGLAARADKFDRYASDARDRAARLLEQGPKL